MMRRGCIYRVRLPGEGKWRPALIVSPDRRNERANTVVLVPCSSVLRQGPWHVPLAKGEGGLSAPSVAKCENITTLEKVRVDPRPLGGPLARARLVEIREAILRALDYDVTEAD